MGGGVTFDTIESESSMVGIWRGREEELNY